jgi:hypothetical protein
LCISQDLEQQIGMLKSTSGDIYVAGNERLRICQH